MTVVAMKQLFVNHDAFTLCVLRQLFRVKWSRSTDERTTTVSYGCWLAQVQTDCRTCKQH